MSLTCGRVDAGSDVEVAESVGVGHVVAVPLVVTVSALMVRQAGGQRWDGHVPIEGGMPRFLKIQLQEKKCSELINHISCML